MEDRNNKIPGFFQMIRAPFLSSILAPIIAGNIIAFIVSGNFSWINFLVVLIMGMALHTATNVYNDIYDTKQGTDAVNVHRNEFSGGSGILQNFPHLMNRMYWIARSSLILALIATGILTLLIDRQLWILLWSLYLLSAFFSKYYTAAPIKLAYRGFGEFSVWFAFGPMAILVAAVSQNVGIRSEILWAMPPTGLSTLSILLVGQLIDLKADSMAGKRGVAARLGSGFASWMYLIIQTILVLNIIALGVFILQASWLILLAVFPYMLIFPKAWRIIHKHHDDPDKLKPAAGMNVQIHLLFSVLYIAGLSVSALLWH
jgi:1,4-dihydroxy-2-naphthoate octaprenyltransferase